MHVVRETGKPCRRLGVRQPTGRLGSALVNAAAEAFDSTIEVEYIHRYSYVPEARHA